MNKLTTAYFWVEGIHTKKIFKNKETVPDEKHRISFQSMSTELKLVDHGFDAVQADLIALIKVTQKYGRYDACCNLFVSSMVLEKNVFEATPVEYLKYVAAINTAKTDWSYWLGIRGHKYDDLGSVEAEKDLQKSPHIVGTLSEDTMYKYVQILTAIPGIAKEINKYLPKNK